MIFKHIAIKDSILCNILYKDGIFVLNIQPYHLYEKVTDGIIGKRDI